MKESRRNDREIRVQDNSITENTNARSPLTFRNSYKLLLKCKAKRDKESKRDMLYQLKYSSNLEASFLVHLPNSQVFAANKIFEIRFSNFRKKWGGATKGS